MIEGLAWRDPARPRHGFTPPAAGWRLWQDQRGSTAPSSATRAVYGRPDGRRFSVTTDTAASADRVQLQRSTTGTRPDGAITGRDGLGAEFVHWDDGRMVTVEGEPGIVGQIADSLTGASVEHLRDLRAAASARLAAFSPQGGADLPAGRVTLARLPGSASVWDAASPLWAVCLTPAGAAPVCGIDEAGRARAYAGLLVGDRWYAVLVDPAGVGPVTYESREQGPGVPRRSWTDWSITTDQRAEAGEIRVLLGVPPTDEDLSVKRDSQETSAAGEHAPRL
jgi:hypothetical protein